VITRSAAIAMSTLISDLTLFTTFICLGLTVWFAIYLLSRSRASSLAFRAILVLIAMAIYYLSLVNELLSGTSGQISVRLFSMTVALIAAHDLTYNLLTPQKQKKQMSIERGVILSGLIVSILIFTAPPSQPCLPSVICPINLNLANLIIEIFNLLVFCSILYNLWSIRKAHEMLHSVAFYTAILIGIGAVTVNFIGTAMKITLPRALPNIFIFSAITIFAYSVVRDRTFVTHSSSTYDLPISLLTIIFIVIIYILIGQKLRLSSTAVILIALLAIFTHSAYDFVRDYLDRMFHHQQRILRHKLDDLGQDVSTQSALQRYLNRGLAILCKNLNAQGGFIAIRQDDHYSVVASLHCVRVADSYTLKEASLEEISSSNSTIFPKIDCLAPGFAGNEQIALIGLGPRKDKVQYTEEDLFWLEDIVHEFSQIIYIHSQPKRHGTQAASGFQERPSAMVNTSLNQDGLLSALAFKPEPELVKYIEEAFQHLSDYDELGKSPLAEVLQVKAGDHLEKGRLVHDRLIQMLEKLRPSGQPPPEPLPREWYAYTILNDSYVNNRLSRDIMGKLYIGEGTYYRIRRQALRSIARVVQEHNSMAGIP
jgi:hypothetical protein